VFDQPRWSFEDSSTGCDTGGTVTLATDGDADRDGAADLLGCDDADASVYPGAADPPGDGIDQDCDGFADAGTDSLVLDYTVDCAGAPLGVQLALQWPLGRAADSATTDGAGDVVATYPDVRGVASAHGGDAVLATAVVTVTDHLDPATPDTVGVVATVLDSTRTVEAQLATELDDAARGSLSADFAGAGFTVVSDIRDCGAGLPGTGVTATGTFDLDGDGYGTGTDCDGANATVNPGAAEVRDGVDNDSDDLLDAADVGAPGLTLSYLDLDGDGFGDPADAQAIGRRHDRAGAGRIEALGARDRLGNAHGARAGLDHQQGGGLGALGGEGLGQGHGGEFLQRGGGGGQGCPGVRRSRPASPQGRDRGRPEAGLRPAAQGAPDRSDENRVPSVTYSGAAAPRGPDPMGAVRPRSLREHRAGSRLGRRSHAPVLCDGPAVEGVAASALAGESVHLLVVYLGSARPT
jgi:hypothetical protein